MKKCASPFYGVRPLFPMLLWALMGCKTIQLNHAMELVHYRYLDLFSQVEIDNREGMAVAAEDLLKALDDSAIKGYSSNADYQNSLEETRVAVRQFLLTMESEIKGKGSSEKSKSPLRLRKQVFKACQSCHKNYR